MDILTDIFADGTLLDLQEDLLKLCLKVSSLKTPFDYSPTRGASREVANLLTKK